MSHNAATRKSRYSIVQINGVCSGKLWEWTGTWRNNHMQEDVGTIKL